QRFTAQRRGLQGRLGGVLRVCRKKIIFAVDYSPMPGEVEHEPICRSQLRDDASYFRIDLVTGRGVGEHLGIDLIEKPFCRILQPLRDQSGVANRKLYT